MQYMRTEWRDGKADIVAVMNPNPPGMYFNYEGSTVANIESNGNLTFKGELHENCDPKLLTCVHETVNGNLWPNPVCFYNGKHVQALLGPDPNTQMGVQWPLCFWNKTDFFVWGELQENVVGPDSQLVVFSQFQDADGSIYNQMGIRGSMVSEFHTMNPDYREFHRKKITDDTQTPSE